jgi:hypothetical protein
MKLVAAALGNDADLSARAAPELRRGYAGLHRELLHRVGDAEITERRVDLRIDDADAVEQEHVGLRTRPGHIEAAALCARRDGRTPGVTRAKSRYWRAFSGMFDITWLSTTLLSVLLSVSSSGVAAEVTSTTWATLPISKGTSTCVIWSTWTKMRRSVTFLKPWDSTTREYSAGANCKNWKPPLVSLTASIFALVARLVSVNLAPEIAAPLGSFTDPAMLPVGEAETVVVMNRRMSAQAAYRRPRDRQLEKTEGVLRRMSISSQFELFFKPQPGVGQVKLAGAYRPLQALVKSEYFA